MTPPRGQLHHRQLPRISLCITVCNAVCCLGCMLLAVNDSTPSSNNLTLEVLISTCDFLHATNLILSSPSLVAALCSLQVAHRTHSSRSTHLSQVVCTTSGACHVAITEIHHSHVVKSISVSLLATTPSSKSIMKRAKLTAQSRQRLVTPQCQYSPDYLVSWVRSPQH